MFLPVDLSMAASPNRLCSEMLDRVPSGDSLVEADFLGKKVIQMSLHVTLMLADCPNLRRMYHVKSTKCPSQETVPFLKNFSISSLISGTNIWSDRVPLPDSKQKQVFV